METDSNINSHSLLRREAFLVAVLCLLITYCSFAQKAKTNYPGAIKGVIVDSINLQALKLASITVQDPFNNEVIKNVLSDNGGYFEIAGLPAFNYKVVISHIGYHIKTIPISLLYTTAGIKKIELIPLVKSLKDVQVSAVRPLVEQFAGKYVYNADMDPESKTLSTFDLLRKMPAITVDAEDNLQLNGSSSYKILVNGKPTSLFVFNPTDIFKLMPANAVKSVEVITTPPSRYDAEGIGGIINIITFKKTINGYTGAVTLATGIPSAFTANGYIAAKAGRLTLSGHVGGNTTVSPVNRNTFFRKDKTSHTALEQTGTSNSSSTSPYFKTELSYEIDSLTTVSAGYNFTIGSNPYYFFQQGNMLDSTGIITEIYENWSNSSSKWSNREFGLDYQHIFKEDGEQSISVSYKWNDNSNTNVGSFFTLQKVNLKDKLSINYSADQYSEQAVQVDYVQLLARQPLEVGIKTVWQINNSDFNYKNFDTAIKQYMPDLSLSNKFHYRQNIYAAYVAYNLKWNNWSVKTGARVERTAVDAMDEASGGFGHEYSNLIPSLYVSRILKNAATAMFSFTQRIERPGFYNLNPFTDITDPRNIVAGNPRLRPAAYYMFNLSINKLIKKASLNANFGYNFSDNAIQRFTTLKSDTIALTTYGNTGKNDNYIFSLSANTTAFKKLNINMNSSISHARFLYTNKSVMQKNAGFMFNIFSYMSYNFGKGWRASGSVGYNSQNIFVQGRTGGYISSTVTVKKEFLKDKKADLILTVNNPFQYRRHTYSEINELLFFQRQDSYLIIRRFTLSFNYRFGKL